MEAVGVIHATAIAIFSKLRPRWTQRASLSPLLFLPLRKQRSPVWLARGCSRRKNASPRLAFMVRPKTARSAVLRGSRLRLAIKQRRGGGFSALKSERRALGERFPPFS